MAVRFNGADGLGQLAQSIAQNVAVATVMAWCRPRGLTGSPTVASVSIGPPPGLSGASRLSIDRAGTTRINITARALDSDGGSGVATTENYNENEWQHIACVVYFTTRLGIIYRNGVELPYAPAGRNFGSMTAGNTSNTQVKAVAVGANEDFISGFWNGDIEDVRFYNRALGVDEIRSIYAGMGVDGIVSGLEARYPLNDGGIGQAVVQCANVADFTRAPLTVRAGAPTFIDGIIRGPRNRSSISTGWR